MVESGTSCTDEPVVTGETPQEDTTLFVLPYEEVKFNVKYISQKERFVTLLCETHSQNYGARLSSWWEIFLALLCSPAIILP